MRNNAGTKLLFGVLLMTATLPSARGDWLVVLSNVVSGTGQPSTNVVVRRLSGEAIREDLSPTISRLFFPQKQEQFILNHKEKTYVRQAALHGLTPEAAAVSEPGEGTEYAGQLATAFRWTNGPARGCIWVGSAQAFLGGLVSGLPESGAPALNSSIGAGSLLEHHRLVLGTEFSGPGPERSSGAKDGAVLVGSNLNVRVQSTLISIAPTNFGAGEFLIPSGYKETSGQAPPPVRMTPEMLGSRMYGDQIFEGLRQEYERGRPLLPPPPGKPVNR